MSQSRRRTSETEAERVIELCARTTSMSSAYRPDGIAGVSVDGLGLFNGDPAAPVPDRTVLVTDRLEQGT